MPTLARTSSFPTQGIDTKEWYANARVQHTIKQHVVGTGKNAYLTVTPTIPANSRIVMATMRACTNVSFSLGQNQTDTTAAQALTGARLGVAMVFTAPSSITSSSTSNLATLISTVAPTAAVITNGISQNATAVRAFQDTVAATNGLILPTTLNLPATLMSGSAAKTIYIAPFGQVTTGDTVYRFCGTVTTSYTFGTSTSDTYSFDVQIVYEEYPESASY